MRVIAGLFRGRRLKSVGGIEVRPTSDRLRETLFDVLGSAVDGSVFLDAYAGSGAVGIEALSRGAKYSIFIENNPAAARILEENLTSLGLRDRALVLHCLVRRGLHVIEERGLRADFCFLDPPYAAENEYDSCLRWLSKFDVMAPTSLVILQHSKKQPPAECSGRWRRVRLLPQGSNALSFYRSDLA